MIAIIELYTKQKWVEPLTPGRYPYSMLYHQTMSYLLSAGEATARELMGAVLRLSCFQEIPQEDYRILLRHLLLIGICKRWRAAGSSSAVQGRRWSAIIISSRCSKCPSIIW